jgi:hypothetical protein
MSELSMANVPNAAGIAAFALIVELLARIKECGDDEEAVLLITRALARVRAMSEAAPSIAPLRGAVVLLENLPGAVIEANVHPAN